MANIKFPRKTAAAITALIIASLLIAGMFLFKGKTRTDSANREKYESYLLALQKNAPRAKKDKNEKEKAADQPEMAAFHDFLMTFDPATGTVPRERLVAAYDQTSSLSASVDNPEILWQGYQSDMGGRTRAIMYDPNDPTHKKVWAGGVTGGLWYNNNITSATSPWVPVGDFWSTMAIRCLAYDPQDPQTFFVGTGEAETALQTYRESSGLGFGIGRSDDGGASWYHIPGTEQFAYVTDIVVRIENNISVIYAGVASGLYKGSQHVSLPSDGLFRSADNGATWQQVLPLITGSTVPYCVSDIALGTDNRLYVGTRPNLDDEGAAVLLYSDNGLQWTVNEQYQAEILDDDINNIPGRVVLATAPSDSNVVYALIASGYLSAANGFKYFTCNHILRSADRGVTWAKKSVPVNLMSGTNFATIAWHALDIAVDPNNANWLYAGGLDVYKTFNGGSNWMQVSDWTKMYGGSGTNYIHADQHVILYKPGSSDEILFGSDGGVFYTPDGSSVVPAFSEHNKGYGTLQAYTCALNPVAGFNQFLGGLQDNGTLLNIGLGDPLTINDMVTGGDGAYCFIHELNPALTITSYYYNQYMVFYDGNFMNAISNWSSGTFICPADLDYKQDILYCNAVDYVGNWRDQILRVTDIGSNPAGSFVNLNTGTQVFFSALKYSPYSTFTSSTLFIGSESGKLFKVKEAQSNTPVVTEIGSSDFPMASISSIAIGKSEDTLMVTFSNYGVPSVWNTYNGGQTWKNIEGNLPDMPVRWALFHPQNNRQALIATETGVWECVNLNQNPVEWFPANSGMANVRVDMLQLRKSDNTVLAATHGRGFFTMTWDLTTGMKTREKSELAVFPNPSAGQFRISGPSTKPGTMEITIRDLSGKTVYQEKCSVEATLDREINMKNQAAGVYLLTVKNGERTRSHKIIIE